MGRDLRNTKLQEEFFTIIGDCQNPTADIFATLFARYDDKSPKYYIDDYITIGPEQSPFVKPNSTTTIGIYIFNKFIIEPMKVFGYIKFRQRRDNIRIDDRQGINTYQDEYAEIAVSPVKVLTPPEQVLIKFRILRRYRIAQVQKLIVTLRIRVVVHDVHVCL